MIKCNSPNEYSSMCIIDMNAQQILGGLIYCDAAEDCEFSKNEILKKCPYAEPTNIKDVVIQD